MDTTADLNEQIYCERVEADMLQAQYEAEARQISALHAQGICTHGSRLGGGVDFYDASDIVAMLTPRSEGGPARFGNRGGFTGAQTDIPAGKDLCTECGELVPEW